VRIHELAIFQLPVSSSNRIFDPRQIEYLHVCASAIKSSLDTLLSLETLEFMNFTVMFHLSHCIQVLQRLICFQHPGWDNEWTRTSGDILSYMGQFCARFEEADERRRLDASSEQKTVFKRGAEIMRSVIPVWASALEKLNKVPDEHMQLNGREVDDVMMEFVNESWFSDIFSSWNT